MQFEWDDEKEKINIVKHGIDFTTAARVFKDQNRLEMYDEAHSDTEDRYITIGIIDGVTYHNRHYRRSDISRYGCVYRARRNN